MSLREKAVERALRLAWPEGVATLAFMVVVAWPRLHGPLAPFLRFFPSVVLATGLLLGWRFGRARLLLGLAALATTGAALLLAGPPGRTAASIAAARTALGLAAILLPLNLAVLAFFSDAGRLIRWVGGALAIQVALGVVVYHQAPAAAADLLYLPVFPVELGGWSRVPQLGSLATLAAALVLGARAIRAPDPAGRGILWAAVAAGVALNTGAPATRTLYLSAGGIALVVAMIEASYSLAFHDELTGLPGRRAFNTTLARLRGDWVVAMVDVDHFKQFNDRYGHDVGDQVLKLVATRLAEVGGGGRAFRYGGEEFAILFSATAVKEVVPHLDALRRLVENTTFTLRGAGRPKKTAEPPKRGRGPRRRDLSVTVSIGVAEAEGGVKPDQVVESADRALYRAKEGGRNRVVAAR